MTVRFVLLLTRLLLRFTRDLSRQSSHVGAPARATRCHYFTYIRLYPLGFGTFYLKIPRNSRARSSPWRAPCSAPAVGWSGDDCGDLSALAAGARSSRGEVGSSTP